MPKSLFFVQPSFQISIHMNDSISIYEPFSCETPADLLAKEVFTTGCMPGPRKAPITPGGSGWTERPDTGKITKSMPIGDAWPFLLYALFYLLFIWRKRQKRHLFLLVLSLFSPLAYAAISALTYSTSAPNAGQTVVITPTIASAPDERIVTLCWSLYHDADCTSEVDDIKFRSAYPIAPNAVRFTAPDAGTYYIKSAIHTGRLCDGLMDSYYVHPLVVYPEDADLILRRDAQESGIRIDLHSSSSMQAYGVLRFSREALDNEELSPFQRYNYFISFPFDVQVADIYGIGSVGSHWLVYYYDGKGRAENGFLEDRTDNWVMIDDTDSILHAGQGYLLQLNAIQMAADATWPNGEDIASLYFPARSTITSVTTANETIPALSEAYQCTIDLSATYGPDGDRRDKDSYWRCIGVPGFSAPSAVTNLPYFYEWNSADNSLNVISSAEYSFAPTHAYLVQNGDEIIWSNVSKPAFAPLIRQAEPDSHELCLTLQQSAETCDRTYIRLSDEDRVSTDFDYHFDLIKERNPGKANLYSFIGYERVAANCLPISETTLTIPLGVQIVSNGEYTFALPSVPDCYTLTLIDAFTDTRTNLALSDYTTSLELGTYDNRFALEIRPALAVPTDNEPVTDASSPVTRKILRDGHLFILRDGHLFDIQGQLLH